MSVLATMIVREYVKARWSQMHAEFVCPPSHVAQLEVCSRTAMENVG